MSQMAEAGARHPISGNSVAGGAVEKLRRDTLVLIARLLAAASLIAILPALYALPLGQYVPFATAIVALATGFAVIAATSRSANAVPMQLLIVSMALIGTFHAILNPALADFGLATASLVPVLAALLGDRGARRLSWVLFLAALGIAELWTYSPVRVPAGLSEGIVGTSTLTYLLFAGATAIAALRLGALLERNDKAQADAFRLLIDAIHYVVLRLTPTGETLFVSRSAESLLGCRRFELTGAGLLERIHVQDRPIYLTALSDAARFNRPRSVELRMRKDEDGSIAVPNFVWIECNMSPIRTTPNTAGPFEVMVLLRDISERVAQREEMNRARLVAQEASLAKSRFLATIGHELRTPLNAVVGFSDMMRNGIAGPGPDATREYAELIHQSGLHLLDTVNMLLDMSKIEAGKFELQIEEFSPESLVAPSIGMVEPMARARGVEVRAEIDPDLPRIMGDERAYRQVAINLLSNAVKFSHPGGRVRFEMGRRGRHVVLSVADAGIGMSPEVVAHLGEPFYQAQDGLSRKFEGTGLGLSIVKGLIELHGGRLEVQSHTGRGTHMTVLMPISGPQAPPAEKVARLPDHAPESQDANPAPRRAAL